MFKRFFSFALLACLLSGCGRYGQLESELAIHEQKWQAQGIENYSLQMQRLCFCPNSEVVVIKVENAKLISMTYLASGKTLNTDEQHYYYDIKGLFGFIHELIQTKADTIQITWNESYAYPEVIAIDYFKNAIDDELTLKVVKFEQRSKIN
jgi:hypothetical protein